MQILHLPPNQMFARFMHFVDPFGLNSGSDNLDRMGDGCWNYPTEDACQHFLNFPLLQLLVEHVIESSEEAFFEAGSYGPAEEPHRPLFLVDTGGSSN